MRLKKHALHLAVTAGMIGSMVTVAAPAAHAATPLPDMCATYLQGTINPDGGLLPSGVIPLVPQSTSQTYGVFGHLAKGQDREVVNLQATGAMVTKASLNVVWGGGQNIGQTVVNPPNAPYLSQGNGGVEPLLGTTNFKLAWKNDRSGAVTFPTVAVSEASKTLGPLLPRAAIAKGYVNGSVGEDQMGVQVGNVQQGNAVDPLNTIDRVVVPQSAAAGSTFKLSMTIPAFEGPPFGGVTFKTLAIPMNPTALQVVNAFDGSPAWGALLGAGTAGVTLNPNPGDFDITFQSALQSQALPLVNADPADQTNDLSTTVLDDGSIWNSTLAGGVDPVVSPITDLGNGIITSQGIMSSGPVGGVGGVPVGPIMTLGRNTGKGNFFQDTEYVFVQYPSSLIPLVAPNLSPSNSAVSLLTSVTGLTAEQVGEACGLGGLLAIFCTDDPANIPAAFAGLCGALTT